MTRARGEWGVFLGALLLSTGVWAGQKIEVPDWKNAVAFELVSSQEPARPGDRLELAVVAQIEPGYHLYGPEENKPSRTEISPEGEGLAFGEVRFPPSIERDLLGLGTYHLYEGHIAIRIPLTVEKDVPVGQDIPVSVKVHYQVCTDFACSAPTSKTLELPLPVGPADAPVERQHESVFAEKSS
jgi:hypothetical protein